MKLSTNISKYISKYYITSISITLSVLIIAVFIGDLVEYARRLGSKEEAGWGTALKLSILHLPFMIQEIIPYAILFGSMLWVNRVSNTQELIIIRSTGLSLWQTFMPIAVISLILGFFIITIFNSLVSATQTRIQQIESEVLGTSLNALSVSGSGFWLRQVANKGTDVIYSREVNAKEMKLLNVTIFKFDNNDNIIKRIDSDSAQLKENFWYLTNVLITDNDSRTDKLESLNIQTSLSKSQIQEGFSSPDTMSIWSLVPFIKMLKRAGFSANTHRLHLHNLLSLPFLLLGMTILGSSLSINTSRKKNLRLKSVIGIGFGFMIFYLMTIIEALGISGKIPILIASWLPAFIPLLLGISLLLHMEET